jgi:hypothetical protein
MWSPSPTGSQQASISIPTRCRGGKRPGAPLPRSVLDDLHADLFVPAAELPDGLAPQLDARRQILHDRGRIRHGQQDAGTTRNALLGASITYELLQVRRVFARQLDDPAWSSSHAGAYLAPGIC